MTVLVPFGDELNQDSRRQDIDKALLYIQV